MSNKTLIVLAASLFAAVPAIASAQIGTDAARVETSVTVEQPVAAPQATGPRAQTTRFAHDTQELVPKSAVARLAPINEGGSNTFTITTLALVLGIILIVVLIAR